MESSWEVVVGEQEILNDVKFSTWTTGLFLFQASTHTPHNFSVLKWPRSHSITGADCLSLHHLTDI